jgi:hypothetical protein
MSKDVAVGMANRSFVKWKLNPADDQLAPVLEAMEVVAEASSYCRRARARESSPSSLHLAH